MPILVLNEEDFLLLSTLPKSTARKSLRHIILGQFDVCCIGPCGIVIEVILYDVWSYDGADHGPFYGWKQLVNLSQNSERVHRLVILNFFSFISATNGSMLGLVCFSEML